MKKIETQYSIDTYDCADKINQLIDENEQLKEQFKILAERAGWDIKPGAKFERTDDTHRTVTLRIPKGMRIGEAIRQVWMEAANSGYLGSVSDTDLQKALDEVQPNE